MKWENRTRILMLAIVCFASLAIYSRNISIIVDTTHATQINQYSKYRPLEYIRASTLPVEVLLVFIFACKSVKFHAELWVSYWHFGKIYQSEPSLHYTYYKYHKSLIYQGIEILTIHWICKEYFSFLFFLMEVSNWEIKKKTRANCIIV
jgi:hypothetical protein